MANELLQSNALIAKCIKVEMSTEFPAITFQLLGEVTEIGDISQTRSRIDVTPFSCADTDDAWLYRKTVDGLYDPVVITMVLNYPDSRNTFSYFTYEQIEDLRTNSDKRSFIIGYPDGATFTFDGRIAEITNRVAFDAAITFEIQIRLADSPIIYSTT